jgi:hypothetical protein
VFFISLARQKPALGSESLNVGTNRGDSISPIGVLTSPSKRRLAFRQPAPFSFCVESGLY